MPMQCFMFTGMMKKHERPRSPKLAACKGLVKTLEAKYVRSHGRKEGLMDNLKLQFLTGSSFETGFLLG
eukprot:1153585-Pelagomonas_calceolata.AAC.1